MTRDVGLTYALIVLDLPYTALDVAQLAWTQDQQFDAITWTAYLRNGSKASGRARLSDLDRPRRLPADRVTGGEIRIPA